MNLKENLKAKLLELSQQPELHPVGDTGFFVKVLTVGDANESKHSGLQELTIAQNLALMLRDEQGNLVFDINNKEDLAILEKMPFAFYMEVSKKENEINSQDFFTKAGSRREAS